MSERPRDWDKELADIDRAIARQGSSPAPSAAPGAVSPPTRPVPSGGATTRGHIVLTWFWVFLAVALAAALLLWPYDKTCGLQLTFFLGAAATTAIFALLGAISAWSHRRGLAHVLSMVVLAWAGVAAAGEILPRVGYAKETRTWLCASAPVVPATSTPTTQQPTQTAPAPVQTAPAPAQSTPARAQTTPTSPAPAAQTPSQPPAR
jgi:hypothetical protein